MEGLDSLGGDFDMDEVERLQEDVEIKQEPQEDKHPARERRFTHQLVIIFSI